MYVTRRDLHATLPSSPSPSDFAKPRTGLDERDTGRPAILWGSETEVESRGTPDSEMRELDQESRVASIAGQKLNVARFELLRLKM